MKQRIPCLPPQTLNQESAFKGQWTGGKTSLPPLSQWDLIGTPWSAKRPWNDWVRVLTSTLTQRKASMHAKGDVLGKRLFSWMPETCTTCHVIPVAILSELPITAHPWLHLENNTVSSLLTICESHHCKQEGWILFPKGKENLARRITKYRQHLPVWHMSHPLLF
jgi:hypothetical protein